MARTPIGVRIELDHIHCHDEGDGIGSAEPYLWTVFFKVDGTTVSVTPGFTLDGEATVEFTPGSHGNLPNSDVDPGEDVDIPGILGDWSTQLVPIGFQEPIPGVDDLGGVAGVVAVLMEEDNVTDDGAEAGHDALNGAVRDAINQIVATRTLTNQEVTDEEIAAFEESIDDIVSDAVSSQQNIFENIWSWLNADDTIGFKAFIFSHDELVPNTVTEFSHRWENEGDWEIFGSVMAVEPCPADALDDIFGSGTGSADDLARLRAFRDGPFRERAGLQEWWKVLQRNTPAVALLLRGDDGLRRESAALFHSMAGALGSKGSSFGQDELREAARIADVLAEKTRSRRLRIDALRAADALRSIRASSIDEAIGSLAAIAPARRPNRPRDVAQ